MTWVKICGITNLEDARAAIDAGADALGFVFHAASPRNVSVATVKAITASLPRQIEKVGVFVSPARDIEDTVARAGLTAIQLHFTDAPDEPQNFSRSSNKKYLALTAQQTTATTSVATYLTGPIDALFLDSGTPDKPGGTGKIFDWKAVSAAVSALSRKHKLVVAGGLTPENVVAAIHTLKPWGVDVSSGVEAVPGKKDPDRVRAFIQAVRHIEVSV
jgi:phosphoribosylanthranilate isomerase